MNLVQQVVMKRAKQKNWIKKLEDFRPGDTVKVHVKIKEGEKERVQVYKGVCIKMQGAGLGRSFTVRKISNGVGVERTFPFSSPNLEKVEVVNRGRVRRSRLYFLRGLSGRAARLDSDLVMSEGDASNAADSAGENTVDAPVAEKAPKAKKAKKTES